jgi:peptide/nickel transport system substrate-binding protein
VFPGTWAYYDGIEPFRYDPDEAIRLLRTAGYNIPAEGGSTRESEDGERLEFDLLHPDDETHSQIAEAIQRDWLEIGVRVTLVPLSFEEMMDEHLTPRDFHAALVDLNLSNSPDPDPYPFWHQAQVTGGQNYAQWDDRPASEYLEQARITLELEERARLYRNFQVRFISQLPALPLYYPVYTYAVDSSVQGVQLGPLYEPSDRFNNVKDWYLLARRSPEASPTQGLTPTP